MLTVSHSLQFADEVGKGDDTVWTGEESPVHGDGRGHGLVRGDGVLALATRPWAVVGGWVGR